MRASYGAGGSKAPRINIADARANAFAPDWSNYTPPKPNFTGVRVFEDFDLAILARYIDWTPFFQTWELAGRYPQILDDAVVGEPARALFEDAQKMLARIIDEKPIKASGVVGLWPANARGDDIVLFSSDSRDQELGTLHGLRQQIKKREDGVNYCLSDFVAPQECGLNDYVGGFAVTAGIGEDAFADSFDRRNDNYSSILSKALADRLAEAFAECMHEKVRRELWGYAADEALSIDDLIREQYQGIRPAAGYPAQPDHTEKDTLFRLLNAEENTGIQLTESFAMSPGASVSGLYFSHPQSLYFGVGKIEADQVKDYARRKNMERAVVERWLSPILNYEPS